MFFGLIYSKYNPHVTNVVNKDSIMIFGPKENFQRLF